MPSIGKSPKEPDIWHKLPERIQAVADRLLGVQIENTDALSLIDRYNSTNCLIYADPPYMADTRSKSIYAYECDDGYLERHRQATERVDDLERQKRERVGKGKTLEGFIRDIESRPLAITEFDEKLWVAIIDRVTVSKDGTMIFRFRNGTEFPT